MQHSLLVPSWTEEQRLKALEGPSLNDLNHFRLSFFNKLDTAILSTGNISRSSALNIGKQFESLIIAGSDTTPVKRAKVNKLTGESTWYKNIKVEHPDTGFAYYIQGNKKC